MTQVRSIIFASSAGPLATTAHVTSSLCPAEILRGILAQHGFTRADDPAGADVILLNTCAIREKAEQKIFSRLGEIKALKKTRDSERYMPTPSHSSILAVALEGGSHAQNIAKHILEL